MPVLRRASLDVAFPASPLYPAGQFGFAMRGVTRKTHLPWTGSRLSSKPRLTRAEVLEAYLFGSRARATTCAAAPGYRVYIDEARADHGAWVIRPTYADLMGVLNTKRCGCRGAEPGIPLLYHRVCATANRSCPAGPSATTQRRGWPWSRYLGLRSANGK